MERRTCPKCGRVLLNAAGTTCSWCGFELPPELQVSKEQIEAAYAAEKEKRAREQQFEDIAEVGHSGRGLVRLPLALGRLARWLNHPVRRL